MAGRAAEVTIVADHSKFERMALALYAGWSEIARLVTDQPPHGGLAFALQRAGVDIVVAG
jgi:DeoR/GlpR family transcriptional regulator of sugar metabolism